MLRHAARGEFTLVLSPIVIDEARNRIQQDLPSVLEAFDLFLLTVAYEEAPIPSPEEIDANSDLVRQSKDVPVALSVRDAQVDYFVTYDRDFTDEDETTRRVQRAIPGILLPPVFLREIMGWTSEELETVRRREWEDFGEE